MHTQFGASMDNQFKVPRIPLVTSGSMLNRPPAIKRSSKKKDRSVAAPSKPAVAAAQSPAPPTTTGNHLHTLPASLSLLSLASMTNFPKLCPPCSKVMVEYLSPMQNYLKELISVVDTTLKPAASQQAAAAVVVGGGENIHPRATSTTTSVVYPSTNERKLVDRSNSGNYHHPSPHVPSTTTTTTVPHPHNYNSPADLMRAQEEGRTSYESKIKPAVIETNYNVNTENRDWKSQTEHTATPHQPMTTMDQGGQQNSNNIHHHHDTALPIYQEQHQQHQQQHHYQQQQQHQQQHYHHREEHHHQPQQQWNPFASKSESNDHHQQSSSPRPSQPTNEVNTYEALNKSTIQAPPPHSETSPAVNESAAEVIAAEVSTVDAIPPAAAAAAAAPVFDPSTPYAYVTIVYNNLSALNAIVLANSICFYNNQTLNVLENHDFVEKRIERQFYIPLVVMLYGSVEQELVRILHQVFDDVIESSQHETLLLNDEQLGIQQYKVHLWNELSHRYRKCLYLDSFTMVIGSIKHLFLEYDELSACVDCFFPDNFNCSVFVFEPNVATYKELVKFGLEQKLENAEEASEFGEAGLDEMTLLNQFFANKWRKLSFIYNFVRNEMTYTQMPAYLRFGENIRIVNFGHQPNQNTSVFVPTRVDGGQGPRNAHGHLATFSSPSQPWNFKFNLRQAELEDEPFETTQVDNYIKFYLRCFMRRVWPLLSQKLAPSLQSQQPNRHDWTLTEMIQILGRLSGTNDNLLEHNPFILRTRKKSWATDQMFHAKVSGGEGGDYAQQQTDLIELQECPLVGEHKQTETTEEGQQQGSLDSDKEDTKKAEEDEVEEEEEVENPQNSEDEKELAQQTDAINKGEWEAGRVDWMGENQSDKIINRLKNLIKK